MEVVGVSGNGPTLRDVVVGLVFGRGDDVNLTEQLGFLSGLLGPNTGLEVSGFAAHQVSGHAEELGAGTATEEQNFILFGDVEEVAPELTGLSHDAFPTRGTVRDFHDADTGVVEVAHSVDR